MVLVRRRRRYLLLAGTVVVILATTLLILTLPRAGNQKPVASSKLTASFTFSPSLPEANQTVAFTGSASGGTAPYSYSWSFGDGVTQSGLSLRHSYTSTGTFRVVLNVSDGASPQHTAIAEQTITVKNAPPPPSSSEIKISYSFSYNNSIFGTNVQPLSGTTFLVVNITVLNAGYQNFTADPFRDMYVVMNHQNYNVSALYIVPGLGEAGFPWSINLNNTQSASGEVVFAVTIPQGSTSFTPGWRNATGVQILFD